MKNDINDTIETWLMVIFWVFVGWMAYSWMFGGDKNYSSNVSIDCRQSQWRNSSYCNGDYDSQVQEQDYRENSYYQNLGR